MAGKDSALANRILVGLVVGAIAGVVVLVVANFVPGILAPARWFATNVCDPLGQVFLRMLFFVVIPLVFASLAGGIVQLGELRDLGPLAARTFVLFFLNMAIAAALGLVMMNVLQPGSRMDEGTSSRLIEQYSGAVHQHAEASKAGAPTITPSSVVDMFMPRNLFGAFVGSDRGMLGEVLPLITFAVLVGAAGLSLPLDRRRRLQDAL